MYMRDDRCCQINNLLDSCYVIIVNDA
jgi:hypothetical protein